MPSLSFNARWADRVQNGAKLHSIRPRRKRPEQWLPGKALHLFTAMRTKHCRRLGIATISSTHDIRIDQTGIEIDGACITSIPLLHAFAQADGFEDYQDFVELFQEVYGLPWRGSLIKWQLANPASPTPKGGQHDEQK